MDDFDLLVPITRDEKETRDAKVIRALAMIATTQEWVSNARVCSAVVLDRDIVSTGVNQNKTHPLARIYSKHPDCIKLHAELDAIIRALKHITPDELRRATLYVCRVKQTISKKNIFGIAKPCLGCARAIAAFGIKRVVYTNDDSTMTIIED